MTKHLNQGPAENALSIGKRILTILVNIIETRLRLLVVELEEEKVNLVQLLIMVGVTLLFLAFTLICLLLLICFAIDPTYRFIVLLITTVTLFVLTLSWAILTVRKARKSTLIKATREQLKIDQAQLNKEPK